MDWIASSPYVCLALTAVMGVGAYFFTRLQKEVDRQQTKAETLDKNFENAMLALRTDFSNQINTVRNDSTNQLSALRDNLASHRLHVAETYVTNDGLTKAVSNLNTTIERLIEVVNSSAQETRTVVSEMHRRIDSKADKS